ncbi:MAG: hypothetical protein WAQ98_19025 [Blastocatellia bacterium]
MEVISFYLELILIKKYPIDYEKAKPHYNGEIWSAALWKIHKEVGGSDANKIILGSHFLINSNPNAGFKESANAIIVAAENLQKSGKIDSKIAIGKIRHILEEQGFTIKNKLNKECPD